MNLNIYYANAVFRDIAASLEYHFKSKNINVEITHKLDNTNRNLWIILGANELPPSTLLPPNYIIYQLEQIYLDNNKWLTDKYIELMRKARMVWDYSKKNIFVLKSHEINAFFVPISYTKNLTQESNESVVKDIDFLFIGSLNQRRLDILQSLERRKYKVMIADGSVWGNDRLDLLNRSKCVLNIHYYGENSPLEMARISILLANKCFVISEIGGDNSLEKDLQKGIVFCYYKDILKTCDKYITEVMTLKRESISKKGFSIFSKMAYNIPNNFYKLINEICKNNSNQSLNKDKGFEIRPISDKDKIEKIELLIDSDGYSSIKVPELVEFPTVSLITPTKNRKHFLSLMLHQVEKLEYPKDKLEWIIVDDSDNLEDFDYINNTIKSIVNNKLKFKCLHLEGKNTISDKRNYAIEQSTGTYIAHIDDDDYYFPHSLKTKVAFLENLQNKNCIGSTDLPVYNLTNDTSILTMSNYLAEASMVYKRKFWENCKFSEHLQGEGYTMTINRRNELLDIPYLFSMIAVNHGKNITGKTRLFTGNIEKQRKDSKALTNLLDVMDEETQDILLSIKKYIQSTK